MPAGTDKILGPNGANMVGDDGKLTKQGELSFVNQVIDLLKYGNEGGLGLVRTNPLVLFPIMPYPGPILPHPSGPSPFFHFAPENFSTIDLTLAQLVTNGEVKKDSEYKKLIIDKLYAPLVKSLNINGSTSLGPIFDPTIFIDKSKDKFKEIKAIPDLPGVLIELSILSTLSQIMPNPGTLAKVMLEKDFGIGDAKVAEIVTLLAAPPVPKPPVIEIPIPLPPPSPNPGPPSFFFDKLAEGIFKLPLEVAKMFLTKIVEKSSIAVDPIEIVTGLIKDIGQLLLKILEPAGMFIAPLKLISASLIVMIKNLIGMVMCDVIGTLFGNGVLVKLVAVIFGL
jgi:hypothetical protein